MGRPLLGFVADPDVAAGSVPSPLHPKTRKTSALWGPRARLWQASGSGFGMAGRCGMLLLSERI